VVGGVFVCNDALGLPGVEQAILEEITPQTDETTKARYDEWKAARLTFKSLN